MKRARVWFWRTLARVAGAFMRWFNVRAAKACGCDACRLMYDARAGARRRRDGVQVLRRQRHAPAVGSEAVVRFEGNSGSHVDIEAIAKTGLIVSVTQALTMDPGEKVEVAAVILDVNHAEALAHGILAACKELHARAVSL